MSAFPWSHPSFSFLTAEDWHELNTRFHRIERLIRMATQAEIDAVTSEITDAAGRIQDKIAELETANPGLDLSGLKAEADALAGIVPAALPTDPTPVDDGSTPAAS